MHTLRAFSHKIAPYLGQAIAALAGKSLDITESNYQQVYDALRDILFMYVDLVESYRGFGHNIDTGTFNGLDYVNSVVIEPEGYTFGIDIGLVQAGSAISLLCALSDAWDENETWNVKGWPLMSEMKNAFDHGRFSHLRGISEAFALGFGENEEKFRDQLEFVYREYVCEYFSKLSKCC